LSNFGRNSASFAPALQPGTAVTTHSSSSLLSANPPACLVVPDGTGTSVPSGKAVGIGFLGAQDDHHQQSEEGEQELDLHHFQ